MSNNKALDIIEKARKRKARWLNLSDLGLTELPSGLSSIEASREAKMMSGMGDIHDDVERASDTYCVHADRESGKSGYRDYNVTESGEIRYIESETDGTVPRDGGRPYGMPPAPK
jgi:hypothetical protein